MTRLERRFIDLIPQVKEILTRISEDDEFRYFLVKQGLVYAFFIVLRDSNYCQVYHEVELAVLDLYDESFNGKVNSDFEEID